MLYSMKTTSATAAAPRVVDAHGLPHLRASKAARACLAADIVDGLAVLQNPTWRLAAAACGVSIASVAHALRLGPEQRQAVRKGQRPLVLPRKPSASPAITSVSTPVITPVTMGARERLDQIVAEIGLDATLTLLVNNERVAA
jgi:hypothetical protein